MSYRSPPSLTSGSPPEGMASHYFKRTVMYIIFGGEVSDRIYLKSCIRLITKAVFLFIYFLLLWPEN